MLPSRALPRRIRWLAQEGLRRAGWVHATTPGEFGSAFEKIYARCAPFTMAPVERMYALYEAVRYLDMLAIEGAIVECGVWRGGSMMMAALASLPHGRTGRPLYLFDTFAGMPEPGPEDGTLAHAQWKDQQRKGGWARSPIDEVRGNLLRLGLAEERLSLVEGRVEETIPASAPERIALLRLDTDWYSSTRHELVYLYPRLEPGGVLIIDDYGHFGGARRAVDEYFEDHGPALLTRIDYSCRLAVKPHR